MRVRIKNWIHRLFDKAEKDELVRRNLYSFIYFFTVLFTLMLVGTITLFTGRKNNDKYFAYYCIWLMQFLGPFLIWNVPVQHPFWEKSKKSVMRLMRILRLVGFISAVIVKNMSEIPYTNIVITPEAKIIFSALYDAVVTSFLANDVLLDMLKK